MDRTDPTRRIVVKAAGLTGLGCLLGLAACGGADDQETPTPVAKDQRTPPAEPCTDLSGLTAGQIAIRDTFGYVDRSDDPDLVCRTCEFWKEAPNGDICGGCTLFAGPVHPAGFCDSYSEA